jgi:hypothetical protein
MVSPTRTAAKPETDRAGFVPTKTIPARITSPMRTKKVSTAALALYFASQLAGSIQALRRHVLLPTIGAVLVFSMVFKIRSAQTVRPEFADGSIARGICQAERILHHQFARQKLCRGVHQLHKHGRNYHRQQPSIREDEMKSRLLAGPGYAASERPLSAKLTASTSENHE